jgi:hypothetical protein
MAKTEKTSDLKYEFTYTEASIANDCDSAAKN